MFYRKKIILPLFLCVCFSQLDAAVNEVIPGDYEAPAVGINLTTLYLAERKMAGPYVDGHKLTDETVTSLISAVKFTTTLDVGGYTVCPMIALPYSVTKSNGDTMSAILGHESVGFSDVLVGATGWLVNDKAKNQYLAATLLLFAPTGEYNPKQLLNIGENRYKSTLNIGYVQKLSDDFFIELSPELALYGKNDNSLGRRIEQNPSYALTTMIRYNQTPQLTLFGGFQQNYGGGTIVEGVAQNDDTRMQKATLGGYYYTLAGTQIFLRYAKEFHTQSGMKISDDFLLRFQWWFK
ncbi:MAG: transporter [Sulfuricurvum sp.]|uniref:transporter n=1 Tax=Sulfuricurvum sp. TaxID=2025608 RepID=UPI002604F240|nr:transporter [Sulfuricurvum sp.]MDD2829230.1 transporter [Sulfuricurvum sp.]MDD4949063.1 transporter [Sulfuricurvum sp.]